MVGGSYRRTVASSRPFRQAYWKSFGRIDLAYCRIWSQQLSQPRNRWRLATAVVTDIIACPFQHSSNARRESRLRNPTININASGLGSRCVARFM